MAITHIWKILRLVQVNDGTGTVCQIQYRVISSEDEFSIPYESDINLPTENIENFIPYSELDEETVLNWLKSRLSEELIDPELRNISKLIVMKSPPKSTSIVTSLPWEPTE